MKIFIILAIVWVISSVLCFIFGSIWSKNAYVYEGFIEVDEENLMVKVHIESDDLIMDKKKDDILLKVVH